MLKFALQNVLSRPLRSTLSVLGLTVAIAGMVGLFSIAGGIEQLVQSTFDQIPGVLVQQRGAPVPIFSTLPANWQSELEETPGVTVVNPQIFSRVNVIDGKNVISPPRFLMGIDIPSRLKLEHGVYDENLLPGSRYLTEDDIGTMNAVISRRIAEEFEKEVGDSLKANGHDLTIVGIYHCGSLLLDVNILMDIGTVREIARFNPESVSCYYAETDGSVSEEELSKQIEETFRGRNVSRWQPSLFGVPLGSGAASKSDDGTEAAVAEEEESDVEVRTADDWSERFDEFSGDLKLFLTLMTAIGVLIAIFSIVNTMLMSVTERMVEFGILRANGWRKSDVVRLITFESGLLGIAGGFLGAIVGWIAVQGINAWQPERMSLYAGPGLLLFSIAFSTVLGVLGGVYPAWQAATKPPMEAIRRV